MRIRHPELTIGTGKTTNPGFLSALVFSLITILLCAAGYFIVQHIIPLLCKVVRGLIYYDITIVTL